MGRKFWKPLSSLFLNNIFYSFNSSPKDKFLDWSKLKAFADDKINVIEKLKFALGKLENIVGKEKNVGYQHTESLKVIWISFVTFEVNGQQIGTV